MEGIIAIGKEIIDGIEHNSLLAEIEKEAESVASIFSKPKPWVFYSSSSSNPNPIITMQNGVFSAFPAMSIQNGTIAALGKTKDEVENAVGKLDANQIIDLKDGCIVPGFVEPHLHIILSAMLQGFLTNCDPLNPDIPQKPDLFLGTIQFLQEKTKNLGENDWFLGYGYDPSRLPVADGKFQDLTFDVFEKYSLNNCPIFIINASGHLAYANVLAYKAAGQKLTNQNGILVEPAAYGPFIKKGLPENWEKLPKLIKGMFTVVKDWRQMGFTTVFDAGVGQLSPTFDALILFGLSKVAGLRIAGAAANLAIGDAVKVVGSGNMPPDGATDLKIKTIKLWMDGSTQGFTAALKDEYNPKMLPSYFSTNPNGWARWIVPESFPIVPRPKDDIFTEMSYWASRGYQLMVHVNGDCAAEVVIEAYKNLPKSSIMHRLEHFTVTTPQQVADAQALNLGVSHTIGHVKYWGEAFQKYILPVPGIPDRASRIDPVKDDFNNGLVYSFNSDSPVSQADALSYVNTAVNRIMYPDDDQVLGKEQCVTVEAALAGITINPAKQILLSDTIGSLEVGKSADFVILSQNISSPTLDTTKISNEWVQETWYKGINRYTRSSI